MEGFTKYLNIADSLDIMIFVNSMESYTLSAFVYDIVDPNTLIISNPIHEGHLYAMETRYDYYFRFYIENSGMYLFKGTVEKRMRFDNLPSVLIRQASEIKKIQRRKFFRVNFRAKGAVIVNRSLSDAELEREKRKALKHSTDVVVEDTVEERIPFDSVDLSGGGIRFHVKKAFEEGMPIVGEVLLNHETIRFTGEVSRVEKKDDFTYEVGIRFIDLNPGVQSKIVAYVFEIERNLIKKGLM
ncbi:flagellar brake protein [Fusibacter tunisiensis]|uniref:C-di-GMP-binding flagellar brake protein YcgR n=1 Tax=Fusibacter tunisiensis TaxID=1008308 RepID=A0ABS2MMH7_9FIRM|nr:PilZ domain-containing protein [Fusibacter tunisiensis]MBM7560605.1 c-di-GMP-binding flagellar brake protein YcgR [Fusibacter tunisiensis]